MDERDYLAVLNAVSQIPFGVGKKLMVDFLQGNVENESVKRNKLDKLSTFGSLAYSELEINTMINTLIMKGLIDYSPIKGNKDIKVLTLTLWGKKELEKPSPLKEKKLHYAKTAITKEDELLFKEFSFFLGDYNDEQKKAIITSSPNTLCIAGAGTGKTTVLTKRIEFLIKFRAVPQEAILAITFTRKARQEMIKRLHKIFPVNNIKVETFNSFCEKILKKHNNLAYDKPVKVVGYGDKLRLFRHALDKQHVSAEKALDLYFNGGQKTKTDDQLFNIFMNDCFFLRDYAKFKGKPLDDLMRGKSSRNSERAKLVYSICKSIEEEMDKLGLRDFADQLLDAITLFKKNPDLIPRFSHILVDEYQDVNSTQIELIKILNPENIFAVGDPRQSIFGWRGSDIRHILNFEQENQSTEVVTLTKNYRSTDCIVSLINSSIKTMGLLDLEPVIRAEKEIKLLNFASDEAEFEFIIQAIASSKGPRNSIFVLARTNKQLNELSLMLKARGIKHIMKNDEGDQDLEVSSDEITLATVHAIKGLEAETVFLIGCTNNNFPCRAQEHPVTELIELEAYNTEEEERRLFYVAMSRARKALYLSYCGKNLTSFITKEMIEIIDPHHDRLKQKTMESFGYKTQKSGAGTSYKIKENELYTSLQEWRRDKSRELGIPAFMIMHDKTLLEIAEKKPLELDEFEDIYGMGYTKTKKYGDEIIEIVKNS
jgi:superfamily I DNA/RNA helicase